MLNVSDFIRLDLCTLQDLRCTEYMKSSLCCLPCAYLIFSYLRMKMADELALLLHTLYCSVFTLGSLEEQSSSLPLSLPVKAVACLRTTAELQSSALFRSFLSDIVNTIYIVSVPAWTVFVTRASVCVVWTMLTELNQWTNEWTSAQQQQQQNGRESKSVHVMVLASATPCEYDHHLTEPPSDFVHLFVCQQRKSRNPPSIVGTAYKMSSTLWAFFVCVHIQPTSCGLLNSIHVLTIRPKRGREIRPSIFLLQWKPNRMIFSTVNSRPSQTKSVNIAVSWYIVAVNVIINLYALHRFDGSSYRGVQFRVHVVSSCVRCSFPAYSQLNVDLSGHNLHRFSFHAPFFCSATETALVQMIVSVCEFSVL